MKISVHQVVGEDCLTVEEGRRLYKHFISELRSGRKVELDFAGVQAVGASFINSSLGFLLRDFEVEELRRLVKVSNWPSAAKKVLGRVVQNSKRYYSSFNESPRKNNKLQEINL